MTPEEARHWHYHLVKMGHPEGTPERRAFHTIAGLEWEYGVEEYDYDTKQWGEFVPMYEKQARGMANMEHFRVARRMVSKPQPHE